jgi:hypothetical protein
VGPAGGETGVPRCLAEVYDLLCAVLSLKYGEKWNIICPPNYRQNYTKPMFSRGACSHQSALIFPVYVLSAKKASEKYLIFFPLFESLGRRFHITIALEI